MFIHGLSAADTLTQSYNDISKNSDDLSSIWKRLKCYIAKNMTTGELAEFDMEKLDFVDDCLMKLYIDIAKLVNEHKEAHKLITDPSHYGKLDGFFEVLQFHVKMKFINSQGSKLWRLYMKDPVCCRYNNWECGTGC